MSDVISFHQHQCKRSNLVLKSCILEKKIVNWQSVLMCCRFKNLCWPLWSKPKCLVTPNIYSDTPGTGHPTTHTLGHMGHARELKVFGLSPKTPFMHLPWIKRRVKQVFAPFLLNCPGEWVCTLHWDLAGVCGCVCVCVVEDDCQQCLWPWLAINSS